MDHLNKGPYHMTAQTMFGLEAILAQELEAIGAAGIQVGNRAVRFLGDRACMYRANLSARTALRILVPIHSFVVRNEDDLYFSIKDMRWEDLMGVHETLAIHCTLHSDLFNHSQYLSQLAKDAIADRFRDRTGERPSVDLDQPDLSIHLHLHGDECTVSLDSSGGSLHKRGYRDQTNLAPINEVLAAGLVMLSGWDKQSNLVDPMCGSGTILIEAAMLAANLPPNHMRPGFGFQRWQSYDRNVWQHTYDEAMAAVRKETPPILGGEISPNVFRKTIANILNAGLKERIKVKNSAFADLPAPAGGGVLILNPPYGERMDKDENIDALYKMIGDTLKKNWAGYSAWVITSNLDAAKQIHLTAKPRIKLYNGSLECRFMRYELYSGTRRVPKVEGTEGSAVGG